MSKAKFLTLMGIAGMAVILAGSSPLSYVRADHCHTTENQTQAPRPQTPDAEAKLPAGSRESTVPSPRRTRAPSRPASPSVAPPIAATASIEQIYSRDLPLAIESLERAVKAVEARDRQTELAELSKAVTMLATIREALGKHIRTQLANSRCPIMGSPIRPESVTANLTRDYKGQKIGFCCAGCPAAWDKLTDAEKQAKLAAARS